LLGKKHFAIHSVNLRWRKSREGHWNVHTTAFSIIYTSPFLHYCLQYFPNVHTQRFWGHLRFVQMFDEVRTPLSDENPFIFWPIYVSVNPLYWPSIPEVHISQHVLVRYTFPFPDRTSHVYIHDAPVVNSLIKKIK